MGCVLKIRHVEPVKVMKRHIRSASFNMKRPHPWPNPEASLGQARGAIGKSKFFYWDAVGPARVAYNELAPGIRRLLEERQRPIPNSDFVWFSIYMVGEEPTSAVPQILFASNDKCHRKESMNLVKASNLLDRFPGMQVGHWVEAPHLGRQQFSAGSSRQHCHMALDTPKKIELVDQVDRAHACQVRLLFDHGSTTSTAAATYSFNNKAHLLVAAHTLFPPTIPQEPAEDTAIRLSSEDDDFEFGGLTTDTDPDEIMDDAIEESLSTSFGSFSETSSRSDTLRRSPSHSRSDSMDATETQTLDDPWEPMEPCMPLGTPPTSESTLQLYIGPPMMCFDLDYAFIVPNSGDKLKLQHMLALSESTVGEPPMGPGVRLQVLLHTAQQGIVTGWMYRDGAYARFSKSISYQEVYHVSLDFPVLPGDCGAVVVDCISGKVYGHIITRGTNTNSGFVVPANLVLDDLSRMSTALPNAAEATNASQVSINSVAAEQLPLAEQYGSNISLQPGKTVFSRSEQRMRWDERFGAWEVPDGDETCSKYATPSQTTSGPPDSPRSLAISISDAVAIQPVSKFELSPKTPIEIYRSALAEILVRLMGCQLVNAQNAIHRPREPWKSDLVVAAPRLYLNENPKDRKLPLELMKAVR